MKNKKLVNKDKFNIKCLLNINQNKVKKYAIHINNINLNFDQRIKKAVRHLIDGIYLRNLREDFDSIDNIKILNIFYNCYYIYTHPSWISFLFLISWCFIFLSFFDNIIVFSDIILDNKKILILEIIFLFIFFIDLILNIIQIISLKYYYNKKSSITKILKLNKYSYNWDYIKILLIFLFIIECILNIIFNFSIRIFFIFKFIFIPLYNRQIRYFIKAIIGTYKQIFEFLLYIFIFNIIYAAIGVKMFKTLNDSKIIYPKWKDYSNYWDLIRGLYILLTFDNWPDILPEIRLDNFTYLLYFLPFIILNLLCFTPIPVAMLYESYKENRKNIENTKIEYKKNCLKCCFDSIINEK